MSRVFSRFRNFWPLLSGLPLAGLLVAALALWVFTALGEDVLEKESFAFDQSILLAIRRLHSPTLDTLMSGITTLGDPKVLVVLSVGLSVALALRRRRAEGLTLLVAGGGAAALNLLLKNLFARSRPELWQRVVAVIIYSFPSGHAMGSLVIYGLVGYLLIKHAKHSRGWIAAATIALIAVIGFSRLYLGVHWPTDIIAGYAAGLVWLTACILTLRLWQGRDSAAEK